MCECARARARARVCVCVCVCVSVCLSVCQSAYQASGEPAVVSGAVSVETMAAVTQTTVSVSPPSVWLAGPLRPVTSVSPFVFMARGEGGGCVRRGGGWVERRWWV